MPKTLTAHNSSEIGLSVSRPHWLVFFDFATPLRLSTRGTVTFDAQSWTGTQMTVAIASDGLSGQVVMTDHDSAMEAKLMAEGATGIAARVYMLYGDGPWSASDDDLWFDGEIGQTRGARGRITIPLVQPEARFAPRWRISQDNGFNHLPPDGLEIATKDGIVILRNE